MSKVAVIDYDAGNTKSVVKALEYLGNDVLLTRDAKALAGSDRVIFPGVGAYFDAINRLESYQLTAVIRELTQKNVPFLGICLGMQMLFSDSEETEGCPDTAVSTVRGLNIMPGHILRFRSDMPDPSHICDSDTLKIPHMGWNSINLTKASSRLFKGLGSEEYMYFVHSYYLRADNPDDVAATCAYGIEFDCAVEHGNIFGCQFHPEKSGEAGLEVLANFCRL